MSNPIIATGNELDGSYVVREMTDDEAAEYAAYKKELEASRKKKETQENARAAARQAVLDKLGLTVDDANALFN